MVCVPSNIANLIFNELQFVSAIRKSTHNLIDNKFIKLYGIALLLGFVTIGSVYAAGDAEVGKEYWAKKCTKCHGKVLPNDHDAFTDLDTTANRLSFYASDAAMITKAANEGYIIPEGNTDEKAKPGTSSNVPMKPWLGMGKDRLGEGKIPSQLAIDVAAYFASFYDKPSSPKITDVAAKDASAVISFTTPKSDLIITSYSVVSDPGKITATGPSSPVTITGLTNGTSYKFTVSAISNAGTSSPSSSSSSVTPVASATTASAPQTPAPQSSVPTTAVTQTVVPQTSVVKTAVNQPAIQTTNAPKAVGNQTPIPQPSVSQTNLPKAR